MMDAIDRAFEDERIFIGRCADAQTLLDRMADYRADHATAVARGLTKARMRLADLLELAENRVVALKAQAIRAKAPRREERDERRPERTPVAAPAMEDNTERQLQRMRAELDEARAAGHRADRAR